MKPWSRLFAEADNSGVYSIGKLSGADQIRQAAEEMGLTFFRLDLSGVIRKQDFLKEAAAAFRFPDHFGENWDAFEDCLTDFDWCEAKGYVLFIDNLEGFAGQAPEEMENARSVFRDAAVYWKGLGTEFFVMLNEKPRNRGKP